MTGCRAEWFAPLPSLLFHAFRPYHHSHSTEAILEWKRAFMDEHGHPPLFSDTFADKKMKKRLESYRKLRKKLHKKMR